MDDLRPQSVKFFQAAKYTIPSPRDFEMPEILPGRICIKSIVIVPMCGKYSKMQYILQFDSTSEK